MTFEATILNKNVDIHPTAIVEKGAQLGVGVKIGPFSIIGKDVILDDHVIVESHAIIKNRTTVGRKSYISAFCILGQRPQDITYDQSLDFYSFDESGNLVKD